jgi:hypothetical protein
MVSKSLKFLFCPRAFSSYSLKILGKSMLLAVSSAQWIRYVYLLPYHWKRQKPWRCDQPTQPATIGRPVTLKCGFIFANLIKPLNSKIS